MTASKPDSEDGASLNRTSRAKPVLTGLLPWIVGFFAAYGIASRFNFDIIPTVVLCGVFGLALAATAPIILGDKHSRNSRRATHCPKCFAEYRSDVAECSDCRVPLVKADTE